MIIIGGGEYIVWIFYVNFFGNVVWKMLCDDLKVFFEVWYVVLFLLILFVVSRVL